MRYCHRMARPEGNVLKCTTVLPEGHFTLCAAVKVVENSPWQPASGQRPEVFDADDIWRCDSTGCLIHPEIPVSWVIASPFRVVERRTFGARRTIGLPRYI